MGAREMARSWRHACAWSFSPHCQRARVHAVPGLVVRRWQGGPVCEPQLPLGPIAADPHDAVAAHDRVHRIGLARERLGVRARHLRAGEVIDATPATPRCCTSRAITPAVASAARRRKAFTGMVLMALSHSHAACHASGGGIADGGRESLLNATQNWRDVDSVVGTA